MPAGSPTIPTYQFMAAAEKNGTEKDAPMWSGHKAPPKVGDVVRTFMNDIGDIKVTGYVVIEGYLSVTGDAIDPPAGFAKQAAECDADEPPIWFGNDFEPVSHG